MNNEYIFKKKKLSKESAIERMEIFFQNGDYLTIRKNEIMDIEMNFYDELIAIGDSFYPVAKNGFVKFKLQDGKAKGESRSLYNPKEYANDRKTYIENRLTKEGLIKCIRIFNYNNWSDTIYGDIFAEMDECYLVLKFKENEKYGPFESEYHKVNIGSVSKNKIRKICIDFENCDSFDVYDDEIVDIQLNFENALEWSSGGYNRQVKNGYMVLRLEKQPYRWENVYTEKKKNKVPDLEKRICGKGVEEIDICRLYISYYGVGYGLTCEEMIELPSFYKGEWITTTEKRNDGYSPDNYCDYDCDDCDDRYNCDECDEDGCEEYGYVSGYAQRQNDKSIMIVFGKALKKDDR